MMNAGHNQRMHPRYSADRYTGDINDLGYHLNRTCYWGNDEVCTYATG
jgi:hypothetical protein